MILLLRLLLACLNIVWAKRGFLSFQVYDTKEDVLYIHIVEPGNLSKDIDEACAASSSNTQHVMRSMLFVDPQHLWADREQEQEYMYDDHTSVDRL
jgi:hypothetical protein